MKLLVLQEKLKEGLNVIERIVSKSLSLPVLNNVLIRADKNFLNLVATNLEIGINWWTLAKVEKKGEIAVPVSLLSGLSSLLPKKQISLQVEDSFLTVECDGFKTQIKGISSEEFPIIPEVSKEDYIELDSAVFCRGLEQVTDIAVISQARPEISGIYFSFFKNVIKIAATDSFRLGEKTFFLEKIGSAPKVFDKEISFILPQKTAREIINIFGEKQGKIKIYFSPNQILLESQMTETQHPQVQLVSRLIEGEYPGYQEIIPKKWETKLILPREEFLNQIRISGLFSGRINEVKIKVFPKEGKIEIFSQNPELGENKSELFGKIEGKEVEVSFNFKFILEGLTHIKTKEVVFELNGLEGPAILKPLGDESYLYVVMPIKAS